MNEINRAKGKRLDLNNPPTSVGGIREIKNAAAL
jgi:hypothetical protein